MEMDTIRYRLFWCLVFRTACVPFWSCTEAIQKPADVWCLPFPFPFGIGLLPGILASQHPAWDVSNGPDSAEENLESSTAPFNDHVRPKRGFAVRVFDVLFWCNLKLKKRERKRKGVYCFRRRICLEIRVFPINRKRGLVIHMRYLTTNSTRRAPSALDLIPRRAPSASPPAPHAPAAASGLSIAAKLAILTQNVEKQLPNFGRLILGCIEADSCR